MEETNIAELRRIRARINQANKLVGSWDNSKITRAREILTEEVSNLDAVIKRLHKKGKASTTPASEK